MRRALHFVLTIAGVVPWALAMLLMLLTTWVALACDRILPGAMVGNCWTYALPRWWRGGGYLLVRNADGQRLFGVLGVPHVAWVKHLDGGEQIEFFEPIRRRGSKWMPWYTVYYAGKVKTRERSHDAK